MSEDSPDEEVKLAGDQGTMRPAPMYEQTEPLLIALLTIRDSVPEGQTGRFVDHGVVWGAEKELDAIVADLRGSRFAAEWIAVSLERPDVLKKRLAWVFED